MIVSDVKVFPAEYYTAEGLCRGTNITFKVNGRCMSSRLNWIESEEGARRRIYKHIEEGVIK
jgi:hypothetical protein